MAKPLDWTSSARSGCHLCYWNVIFKKSCAYLTWITWRLYSFVRIVVHVQSYSGRRKVKNSSVDGVHMFKLLKSVLAKHFFCSLPLRLIVCGVPSVPYTLYKSRQLSQPHTKLADQTLFRLAVTAITSFYETTIGSKGHQTLDQCVLCTNSPIQGSGHARLGSKVIFTATKYW